MVDEKMNDEKKGLLEAQCKKAFDGVYFFFPTSCFRILFVCVFLRIKKCVFVSFLLCHCAYENLDDEILHQTAIKTAIDTENIGYLNYDKFSKLVKSLQREGKRYLAAAIHTAKN